MATIRSGILSQTRGKVAGVVGAAWKGINYLREYVVPSNPNTVNQQAQRNLMRTAVAFIRPAVGAVLNVYMDPLTRRMSAFNRWISRNIRTISATPAAGTVTLTEGTLTPLPNPSSGTRSGQNITFSISNSLAGGDMPTDVIYAAIRGQTSGNWGFANAEVTRGSAATVSIQVAAGLIGTSEVIDAWFFSARRDGTQIVAVSTSMNARPTIS